MRLNKTKLEILMAEKGMSATTLAEKSKICRQSISTIKGRGTCHPETLKKIADALNVSVAELVLLEKE